MADTQASEAARSLANTRWGETVLRRAAATVLERADGRLSTEVRTELEQIAGDPARDGGER
jgi:hypothetical protein